MSHLFQIDDERVGVAAARRKARRMIGFEKEKKTRANTMATHHTDDTFVEGASEFDRKYKVHFDIF